MIRGLSYAGRLTLAYSTIFSVALVLFGGTAYATVHFALAAGFDARVSTAAAAARTIPDVRRGRIVFDPDDRTQFLDLLNESHVNGVTIDRDGTVILSNLVRPQPEVLAALAGSAPHSGNVRVGPSEIAYVAYPIFDGANVLGYVGVWDARSVYDNAARLTLVALALVAAVLVAAGTAAGRTLIRRMLQPVAELSELISHIEATDLSERLRWSGPEDELGRLCAAFDRLLDRLAAAFDRERQFTADASHELRTPLSVLRAEIELALAQERTPDAYRAALSRLERETRRLETLAESLLVVARLDARERTSLEAVLLDVPASRAVERMRALAQQRGVELALHGGSALVVCDAAALEGALIAVLDNALRFTPAGSAVRVAVTGDAGTATVAVRDGGPGFTEAGLREATGRFWRDDGSRDGGAAGLGLAIASAVVERHNGELRLRNAADGGAVVEIVLPLASGAQGANSGVIGRTVGSSA